MMWVAVFGGIMNAMNAFDPLVRVVVHASKNVHQLLGWCGVFCFLSNMALADETAQVVVVSPIVRNIVENDVVCDDEKDMSHSLFYFMPHSFTAFRFQLAPDTFCILLLRILHSSCR